MATENDEDKGETQGLREINLELAKLAHIFSTGDRMSGRCYFGLCTAIGLVTYFGVEKLSNGILILSNDVRILGGLYLMLLVGWIFLLGTSDAACI